MEFVVWMSRFAKWCGQDHSSLQSENFNKKMKQSSKVRYVRDAAFILRRLRYLSDQKLRLNEQENLLKDKLFALEQKYFSEDLSGNSEKVKFTFLPEDPWQHFWSECSVFLKKSPYFVPFALLPAPDSDLTSDQSSFEVDSSQQKNQKFYNPRYLDQESDELLNILSL